MIKIVVVSLICSILITYLKKINSELTILAEITSGIILLFFAFEYVYSAFSFIKEILDGTGIDKDLFKILIKITGIGYLVEFSAEIVEDFGLKSLASKLVFAGKVIIICMSMPIIYGVFNLIKELLK